MNFKKSIFVILIFLLIFPIAFAELSLRTSKFEYSKGEIIIIDGNTSSNVSLKVYATNGNKKIFDGIVRRDENRAFEQRLRTDCSYPSGEYKIDATIQEDSSTQTIVVKSSRECAFLTVAFLSPSPTVYKRTESFDVSVKVTDSGKIINNAKVFFWGLDGGQQRLAFKGEGIYSFESFKIPFDSKLFDWQLMVTAIANTPSGTFGGENTVMLSLVNGAIDIDVVKPKAKEFSFGQPLELIINPKYPSSENVFGANARAVIGEKSFNFAEVSAGEYVLSIPTDDLNNAVLKIDLIAVDSVGNSGQSTISLEPSGYWFWFLQRNAIFYIFPILFIAYLVFLSWRQSRASFKKISLEKKKTKMLELKKKLQNDYFNQGIISRETYNEQAENLDGELGEIEQKLLELKKKQEV